MGCLLLLIALISPRLALLVLWLTTNFVDRAFDSVLVPLLGIVLFPITTLVYVLAYAPGPGVGGLGWVMVGIAFILDVSSYGGASRHRRA
jgi:hypothetical protein